MRTWVTFLTQHPGSRLEMAVSADGTSDAQRAHRKAAAVVRLLAAAGIEAHRIQLSLTPAATADARGQISLALVQP